MRKRKFNIWQIIEPLMPKQRKDQKDIHAELANTIAERKIILQQWEKLFIPKPAVVKKDIHEQLQETISGLRKQGQIWMTENKAA